MQKYEACQAEATAKEDELSAMAGQFEAAKAEVGSIRQAEVAMEAQPYRVEQQIVATSTKVYVAAVRWRSPRAAAEVAMDAQPSRAKQQIARHVSQGARGGSKVALTRRDGSGGDGCLVI